LDARDDGRAEPVQLPRSLLTVLESSRVQLAEDAVQLSVVRLRHGVHTFASEGDACIPTSRQPDHRFPGLLGARITAASPRLGQLLFAECLHAGRARQANVPD